MISPSYLMKQTVNTIEEGNKIISGHFVMKCSCGEQLNSCRCMGPNKQIIIVRNGCDECKGKD